MKKKSTMKRKMYADEIKLLLQNPGIPLLVTTMLCSSVGLLMLKFGQQNRWMCFLILGYFLEGFAFLMYPINMNHFTMRFVVVVWSACSTFTAFVGGVIFFEEELSLNAGMGCCLTLCGIGMVAFPELF